MTALSAAVEERNASGVDYSGEVLLGSGAPAASRSAHQGAKPLRRSQTEEGAGEPRRACSSCCARYGTYELDGALG